MRLPLDADEKQLLKLCQTITSCAGCAHGVRWMGDHKRMVATLPGASQPSLSRAHNPGRHVHHVCKVTASVSTVMIAAMR